MTEERLREFLVLSRIGNYQKAAEVLYISQSALSRHIMRLERELGVSLFDRISYGNRLTRYGRAFLPYAERILELSDQCREEINQKIQREREQLKIGIPRNSGYYGVLDLLGDFEEVSPDISVSAEEDFPDRQKEKLRNGEYAASFCLETETPERDEFSRVPFDSDELSLFLPENHLLSHQETVDLRQLKGETFFLAPLRGTLYDSFMLACRRAGFQPNIRAVSSGTACHLAEQGKGVCVVLRKPSADFRFEGICLAKMTPQVRIEINLLYLPENLTQEGDAFLNFVRDYGAAPEERKPLREGEEYSGGLGRKSKEPA